MKSKRKHSNVFAGFMLFIFTVVFFGCGTTSYYRMVEPLEGEMSRFTVLEITDADNYVSKTFNEEYCTVLENEFVKAASKMERFHQVSHCTGIVEDPTATNVLVIKPTVVGYEPGSGAKRYFTGGFGAGKAVLQVQLEFFDKSNGEKIGECVLTSEAMRAGTNVFRPMRQQFVAFIDRYM